MKANSELTRRGAAFSAGRIRVMAWRAVFDSSCWRRNRMRNAGMREKSSALASLLVDH